MSKLLRHLRGIPGGGGAALLEGRLQLGQLLRRGAWARAIIGVDDLGEGNRRQSRAGRSAHPNLFKS